MFTQPLMYKKINSHLPINAIYEQQLIEEGVTTQEEIDKKHRQPILNQLEVAFERAKNREIDYKEWENKVWEDIKKSDKWGKMTNTGVALDKLQSIGTEINTIPKNFQCHPQLRKIYEARLKTVTEGKGLDWATCEALAWASLINEGYHVRISGQDVERGTFSHRHAVLHHQGSDETYVPLANLDRTTNLRKFIASNSHLSEYAVLGFEYGYSIANPNTLVMWEAQFGDFANGAQIMIDQFIASGEAKWNTKTGLVLLLPHGFDGQGPEHSSARLERFLQLCDDDADKVPRFEKDFFQKQAKNANWAVVNCSTSANYFHVLRRQLRRDFRKPLIVMSPKKLLRLKEACSEMSMMTEGLKFKRVIPERDIEFVNAPSNVKRLILCSG